MFGALGHRSFRFLWMSALIIQLGYWFTTIAFQWEVGHRTDNDPRWLGVLYFCTFMPYLLFSLPAGVLADSRDRRRLLLATQLVAFTLATVCTVLAALDAMPTPVVLVLAFLGGCVVATISPTNQALTANTVPAADLAAAIPLQSVALNLARICGPALAGPVLLFAGSTGAFAVYCVLCLAVLLLARQIRVPERELPVGTETVRRRVLAGIAHARSRPPALAALAIVAITSIFGCAFQSQLPLLGARVAADGDSAFLALVVVGGVGSLLGVVLVAGRRSRVTLVGCAWQLVALGLCVAGLGLIRSFVPMALLMVTVGALTFSIMTSINTLLQQLVDDVQRGRLMSLYFVCWGGLLPFGGLGIGSVIHALQEPAAFALFGGIAAVAGAVIATRSTPPPRVDAATARS